MTQACLDYRAGEAGTHMTGTDPKNMVARGGIEPPARGFSVTN